MPIPYQGSKRKSAHKIYSTISKLNPESKFLVDLVCGGFAVGEYFIKKGWSVIANDKNKYVVALLKKVIFEGLPEDIVTKFVTREMFFDISRDNSDNYEPWYVGFVQCGYSFGNNQVTYLFGKDIEHIKKAGHELVVNSNSALIQGMLTKEQIDRVFQYKDRIRRRIELRRISVELQSRTLELQQLQQLEQLQRLQQLQRKQNVRLFSDDYKNIVIPTDAIVYCDIPYKGTSEYKEGGFNHDDFWEWCRQIAKTNKVYVSEYTAPSDFETVLQWEQKSTLQGGTQKHNNQPKEKLFAPIGQDNFLHKEYMQLSLL